MATVQAILERVDLLYAHMCVPLCSRSIVGHNNSSIHIAAVRGGGTQTKHKPPPPLLNKTSCRNAPSLMHAGTTSPREAPNSESPL